MIEEHKLRAVCIGGSQTQTAVFLLQKNITLNSFRDASGYYAQHKATK